LTFALLQNTDPKIEVDHFPDLNWIWMSRVDIAYSVPERPCTIARTDRFVYSNGRNIFRGFMKMAENTPSGPVETGADMDYEQHEQTYHLFLALAKYGTLFCVALLISMAFGFFTPAGFISSVILFIIVLGAGSFLL
jgi:hypothetical protein